MTTKRRNADVPRKQKHRKNNHMPGGGDYLCRLVFIGGAMKNIEIDIETYSSVSLQKCGVYKYAESPDFEILLFG